MRRRISIRGGVRPSVGSSFGPSIGPSIGPSVHWSIRPSVCPVLFSKVKRTHTWRILCRVSGLVGKKPWECPTSQWFVWRRKCRKTMRRLSHVKEPACNGSSKVFVAPVVTTKVKTHTQYWISNASISPSAMLWYRVDQKKSKSCSRPAREVRFLAWSSGCLKQHIYSDIRHCKILTFFAVFHGDFWSINFQSF